MILYRHREQGASHIDAPPELVGFRSVVDDTAVCHGFDQEGHVVGLCSPLLWRPAAPDAVWSPIADGWEVASDGRSFVPMQHIRARSFARVVLVEDADGRSWAAPVILSAAGVRAFPVAYGGPDLMPQPTADQMKAIAIATEARTLLKAAAERGPELDPAQSIPWAAWALTLTHHLSVPTIGAQCLIDERLAQEVLIVMAGTAQ